MATFPFEALGEPFYPRYNAYLEKDAGGVPIVMYDLRALFNRDQCDAMQKYAEENPKTWPNTVMDMQTRSTNFWPNCIKCKLDGNRQRFVFPSIVQAQNSPTVTQFEPVKLLIIGEGPGRTEDEQGMGYIGDAGRLLFSMLTQMWQNNMPTLMLGNAVWCWPQDNKTPNMSWYKNCGSKLWPYILCDDSLIADNCLIVVTGGTAYKMICAAADGNPEVSSITAVHGRPTELTFTYGDVTRTFPVMPTLHPAAALHSPERLPDVIADFQQVYVVYKKIQNLGEGESVVEGRDENTIDLDRDIVGKLYKEMLTPIEINDLVSEIAELYKDYEDKTVSFDVETKNINTADPTNFISLAGIGAVQSHTYQFVDHAIGSLGAIFHKLRDLDFKIVGQNIWFDIMMCWKERLFECVDELPNIRDTRVMHKLIDENSTDNGLKFMCQKYFGIPDWSMALNAHTNAAGQLDWTAIPANVLQKYHRGDLYWTLRLYYLFAEKCADPEVSEHWVVDYVAFKSDLQKELIQTSINGFKLDMEALGNQMAEHKSKMEEFIGWFQKPEYMRIIAGFNQVEDKDLRDAVLKDLCNFPQVDSYDATKDIFNPNSSQHLAALLAATMDDSVKLKLMKVLGRDAKTKTGRMALGADNIEKICDALANNTNVLGHTSRQYEPLIEAIKKISEFKKLTKISGTYLEGMIKHTWSDECVRCQWNVDGAATGRLSAARPNLQNQPRGDTAKGIKSMFIPKHDGWILMQFDLSQAELRGLGSFTHDQNLKHAYDQGLDLHKFTAANMFYGGDISKVDKHHRSVAKTLNFATVYGASPSVIAKNANIDIQEATEAMQKWFGVYSKVKPWMEDRGNEVDEQGYCLGLWGLKRRLPPSLGKEADMSDLKRQAGNFPIQNFASDFNCFLMLQIMDKVKAEGLRGVIQMVNTVHDSIVFEVDPDYASTLAQFYQEAMAAMNEWCAELIGPEFYVTMRGDMEIGLNYGTLVEAKIDPETYSITVEAE